MGVRVTALAIAIASVVLGQWPLAQADLTVFFGNLHSHTALSDGSGTPYRVRMRPPCFFTTAGVERMIVGQMLADVVPCFGSVNLVGGECDR